MRGVNLRRAASSDAAAASSPSDSDSEDDAAAKSGRLESDSEFSDRRSGGMGGIPAGGAGPPGGATGTSSSAVKSIVVASCCSITASRGRSGVGRLANVYSRVPRRWLLASRASVHFCRVVAHRSFARALRSSRCSAAYFVGVAAHRTSDAGTVRLSRLATEVSEVQKNRVVRSRAVVYACWPATAGRASGTE